MIWFLATSLSPTLPSILVQHIQKLFKGKAIYNSVGPIYG